LLIFTTCPENTAAESDSACLALSFWLLPRIAQVQAEAQSGSKATRPTARRATEARPVSSRVGLTTRSMPYSPECLE
jgi:hypothetical protein